MLVALSIVVAALLITNIWLLSRYVKYCNRIQQKGVFGKWPIPKISLDELDPIFASGALGPTIETEVKFIGRSNIVVPGGTSDAEAWILSVLAKKAKSIFEFGTCTGKTAYLMASNSPEEAKITTLTLPPAQIGEYVRESNDNKRAVEDAINESIFTSFLYSDTAQERKIHQLFVDSRNLDVHCYKNKIDLIFIDGSHAYSYIMSDSYKAFDMIAPGGIILWHDYRGPYETKDVFRGLNELSKDYPIRHIAGTSLVAYRDARKKL